MASSMEATGRTTAETRVAFCVNWSTRLAVVMGTSLSGVNNTAGNAGRAAGRTWDSAR